MVFFFGGAGKPKGPADLCRQTRQSLQKLAQATDETQIAQLEEEVSKFVEELKAIITGTRERIPTNQEQHRLILSMIDENLCYWLVKGLPKISFERRKSIQAVLVAAVRFRIGDVPTTDHPPAVKHIFQDSPETLIELCRGYEYSCAMQCGNVLQEAFKFDSLCALILYHEGDPPRRGLALVNPNDRATGNGIFWSFFKYIDRSSFEASANAFETFRCLLTAHKGLVHHFLKTNAGLFFNRYHQILMHSGSYVTKRQSIKLLADILLDRTHYELMAGYVKDPENLKLAMNFLRDQRRMIAYEAFHIFKIFVADPEKSHGILKISIMNKHRLSAFLRAFLAERNEEGQFADEKDYCLSVIEALPETVPERPTNRQSQRQSLFVGDLGGAKRQSVYQTAYDKSVARMSMKPQMQPALEEEDGQFTARRSYPVKGVAV